VDGVCAYEFKAGAQNLTYGIDADPRRPMILDIGSQSVSASTRPSTTPRPWCGTAPRGLRDRALRPGHGGGGPPCGRAHEIGKLVSVAGGGDTVAALNHAGVAESFTYVSTAAAPSSNGSKGKSLPGVEALRA
jgi:phosphoglycerate kinase